MFIKAFHFFIAPFRYRITKAFFYALLISFLARLLFYLLNFEWIQPKFSLQIVKTLFLGSYFDLPVIAFSYIPFLLHQIIFLPPNKPHHPSSFLFTLCTLPSLLLNFIDIPFAKVTLRRTGAEIFSLVSDEGNHILPYLTDYWPLLALFILSTLAIYRFFPSGNPLPISFSPKSLPALAKSLAALLLVAASWILMARGGTRLKPLRAQAAPEFVASNLVPLLNSTALQVLSTINAPALPAFQFMPAKQAEAIVLPFFSPNTSQPFSKKNVVFLIVESLSRDYTGFLNNQPFTPHLDSLSKRCTNFPFCYANGTKSIDMLPSLFCGIPALTDGHFVLSSYSQNTFKNAFAIMASQGYQTAFFHGGANGTMGFREFLKHSGPSLYFGIEEYPHPKADYDGNWGIYDEPYLKYFANCLDTFSKPFFSAIFTLSSHHPYSIPQKYQNALPKGKLPIHQSMAYTDLAIGKFFQYAATKPWFNQTIFVITSDHTSYGTEDYFYTETGKFEIPFLIYEPGSPPQTINTTTCQNDIFPTLMARMHFPKPFFFMGRNAADSLYKGCSIHISNGNYVMLRFPYTLILSPNGTIKEFYTRYRNHKKPTYLAINHPEALDMAKYLKAYLQVFSAKQRANQFFMP